MNELVDMAKLAEQAERYDDMVNYMTELTEKKPTLTDEQRNLLSVAFKNVVGARRSAWRITSSMESRFVEKNDTKQVELAKTYREEIEKELEVGQLKFLFGGKILLISTDFKTGDYHHFK